MDSNLNPISSYGNQWSADSAHHQGNTNILDAQQSEITYHPDSSSLEPGKTYSFQFKCDNPSAIATDINLNRQEIPVTTIPDADGTTVTLHFQVPSDLLPQDQMEIRFSLHSSSNVIVSLSDFKMGESVPVDTIPLMNEKSA